VLPMAAIAHCSSNATRTNKKNATKLLNIYI
jgi:hypothetical protein